MQIFGLGKKTGIDLTNEATGFVPSAAWKQATKNTPWFIGDTYNLSIGQGDLLVTPLQVAHYTAAIANGGFDVTPHLAFSASSTPRAIAIPKEAIETVRLGMRDMAIQGGVAVLRDLPMSIGGKTGTAQWRSDRNTHAWFTSFAPFDQPEIVVTVLAEDAGEGFRYAAPVAKEVLAAWWRARQARGMSF
jgi:penicillin-binding protein 2